MAERATGIRVSNPSDYIATQLASEQAEGHPRLIQIISVAAGKAEENGNYGYRVVSTDDSYDVTSVSGDITTGDNSFLACYTKHTSAVGSCLITPLLCNSDGAVMGYLPSKKSVVTVPVVSGSHYLSNCLTWDILETGAYYVYLHVVEISNSNTVELRCYTF